jgi:hypothetical protein
LAISSATVKPIPATAPPPATAAQPTGGRSRPRLSFTTSQEPPMMPIGFPARYPNSTPRVIGEVNPRARESASTAIPALASAKAGTMT